MATMQEIYLVVHKYLLSNCYMLGPPVLGDGETVESKIKHLPVGG